MLVDFQIFLDSMGFAQGIILGILLLILSNKKRKSTFYLGLFVMFFALELVHYIGRSLILNGDYPDLLLLPFNFSWLLFPLFLIYTYKVSVFSNRRPPYWVVIPGIIVILIQVYIFFLPYQTKIAIEAMPFHNLFFTYLGIIYSWVIAIWNLKLLHQHRIEVRNSFSHVEAKELQWARTFILFSIIASVVTHALYFISHTNPYFKIFFSTIDLITIYWVAFHGLSQSNIRSVLNNQNTIYAFNSKLSNTTKTQVNSNVKIQELAEKINDYVIKSNAFSNSDLTIIDIAESLKIHPKLVSNAINTVQKQNFNSYINQFRIEKAIELLASTALNNYSMEGIGAEVGFNSKSAFYTAFKKVTGTTPTKYKEQSAA